MVRLERFVDAAGPPPGRSPGGPAPSGGSERSERGGSFTPPGRSPRGPADDRVAVVGSGVAGLSAAWHLERAGCRPVLFEAERRFGGHAHTVDLTLAGPHGQRVTHGVDTGFLVYNQRTYPGLIGWFDALGVETAASDMSFSVQSPPWRGARRARGRLEWSGSNLDSLFAQRRNLASPRFLAMLAQVLRFNRLGTRLARAAAAAPAFADVAAPALAATAAPPFAAAATPTIAAAAASAIADETVAAFLERHRFGRDFRDGYLLPMIACIWSCPAEQMLEFPVATLLRFCDNHGLMQVNDRPPWFTVRGGSRRYVDAVIATLSDARAGEPVLAVRRDDHGVWLDTAFGPQRFAAVVLACHAPQALRLLGPDASDRERDVLRAITTQPNRAVLHTDASVMPTARRAWAAWNFERASPGDADSRPHARFAHGPPGPARATSWPRGLARLGSGPAAGPPGDDQPVCVHYWINRLQPLPFASDVFVSLNPCREPAASKVIARFDYAHPVFDLAALDAQARLPAIQGARRTWFAGAWCGYGFHEDGFQAGRRAAEAVAAFARHEAAAFEGDVVAGDVVAREVVADAVAGDVVAALLPLAAA